MSVRGISDRSRRISNFRRMRGGEDLLLVEFTVSCGSRVLPTLEISSSNVVVGSWVFETSLVDFPAVRVDLFTRWMVSRKDCTVYPISLLISGSSECTSHHALLAKTSES